MRGRARYLFLVALVVAPLAACGGSTGGDNAMPASWGRTPGALNPDVTQTTLATTVCVPGYSKRIRPPASYTGELKRRQIREWGLPGGPGDYQEDHLISLSLGGHPTDPRNLWPEPRPRADEVDRIEIALHDDLCAGRITLLEAQTRESRLKHDVG
jgi:hypothetical protein